MGKREGIVLGLVLAAAVVLTAIRLSRPGLPESPSPPERRVRPAARGAPTAPRPVSVARRPSVRRLSPSKSLVRPSGPLERTGSEQIDMIVGLGCETRYGPRVAAAHTLSKTLNREHIKTLRDFLAAPYDAKTTELNVRQINAIKNDVLNALLSQETLPEGLGEQMVEMAADPGLDAIWRDYCVQHFAPYYLKKYPAPMEAGERDEARERYIRACWEYVRTPGGPLTGTALLALERLSERREEFDKAEIGAAALAIAREARSDVTARIPSLQIAARMKVGAVAPVARALAGGKATHTLRLSAIATLGEVGTEQDLGFLDRLAGGEDRHLRRAAAEAGARIRKKTAGERAAGPRAEPATRAVGGGAEA